MKIFPPEEDVTLYEEGFGSDDFLDRRQTGKMLSSLLERFQDPIVVALDGNWGAGKTHFLKRWVGAHTLENEGKAKTVYFDAFAHDFLDDPLIAITHAIGEQLPSSTNAKPLRKIRQATAKLAKPFARAGIAVATYGLSEIAAPVFDVALQTGKKELEEAVGQFWKREDGKRQAMKDLDSALRSLVSSEKEGDEAPLIIVVDELDRCRPDFALETLEVIKHFFSIPRLHFVLGVNLEALQKSVKSRYGHDFDSERYLRRFIPLTIQLPEHSGRDGSKSVQISYLQSAADKMGINPRLRNRLSAHLQRILINEQVSIRDVGRLLTHAALVPAEGDYDQYYLGHFEILISLLCIRALKPELYKDATRSRIDISELKSFYGCGSTAPHHDDDQNLDTDIISYWEYFCGLADKETFIEDGHARAFSSFSSRLPPTDLPAQLSRSHLEIFRTEELLTAPK